MVIDCTLWLQRSSPQLRLFVMLSYVCDKNCLGALSVDESMGLAQAVCGGNSGTMCFVLLPQPHSSAPHSAILGHRRLVEDRAIASLSSVCQQFFVIT